MRLFIYLCMEIKDSLEDGMLLKITHTKQYKFMPNLELTICGLKVLNYDYMTCDLYKQVKYKHVYNVT